MKRILSAAGMAAVALAMTACGDTTNDAAEMDVDAASIQAALDAPAPAPDRRVAATDPRDAAAQSYILYREPALRPSTSGRDEVIVRGERNETLARTGGLTGNMVVGVDPRMAAGQ